jgi:hypothetical protein
MARTEWSFCGNYVPFWQKKHKVLLRTWTTSSVWGKPEQMLGTHEIDCRHVNDMEMYFLRWK